MRDLVFSNSFFDKEKRRSFIVGEPMKRSWAADLKILEDVKGVCEKYSLNIFACYGTLLGAIRDHGFIAWDDDIDLGQLTLDIAGAYPAEAAVSKWQRSVMLKKNVVKNIIF